MAVVILLSLSGIFRALARFLSQKKGPSTSPSPAPETDPLLALAGSGKELWRDEHADEYVRRLREGWE